MDRIKEFFRRQGPTVFAMTGAVILIIISLLDFMLQVNSNISADMFHQNQAVLENGVRLLQNEVGYLKRLTETAATVMRQPDDMSDEQIIGELQNYAQTSQIIRALFVTLEGDAYTSYAGYLGRPDSTPSLDGVPLSEIQSAFVSQPFYAEELDKVIFGVAVPTLLGGKKGVLVSSYDVVRLGTLFQNSFMGGMVQTGIVKQTGEVILGQRLDWEKVEFRKNIFDSFYNKSIRFSGRTVDEMRLDMSTGASGSLIYSFQGIDRYLSYAPTGVNDWYITVMTPEYVLRQKSVSIEKTGLLLTIKLVLIMMGLLLVIITIRHREQQRIHRILQKAAMLDGLTGIYNRNAVEQAITSHLAGEGSGGRHALFLMDIDNFKGINDTCGHVAGDNVLTELARLLRVQFCQEDIYGRMGGDEFILLYKDYSSLDVVRVKTEKLIRAFWEKSSGGATPSSLSIGISLYSADGKTFPELYQQADKALYKTKQRGKNGYSFYSGD